MSHGALHTLMRMRLDVSFFIENVNNKFLSNRARIL